MEMFFDLNERPDSIWVSGNDPEFDASELGMFDENDRKKVRFLIRPTTKLISKEMIDKNTETVKESQFIDGKRQTVKKEVIDWDKYAEDQLDHSIETWEGVNSKDGPIVCNQETKILYANNYPGIGAACIRLSGKILAQAEVDRIQQMKESEKNLPSGLNGQPNEAKK